MLTWRLWKTAKRPHGIYCHEGAFGGLIHNSACAYAYMAQPQFSHVAPIWGVQRESELDEFLSYQVCPPGLDERLMKEIEADRQQLSEISAGAAATVCHVLWGLRLITVQG